MITKRNKLKIFSIILFILSCIGLIFYIHTSTTFDENYTLLLVNNKITNLINFDSLDVHPPLYYIVLKVFLILTTSWTKSIFIKIIMSRVLSLVFSIITYIYIYKILSLYHLNINWIYGWIIFIALPNALSSIDPYHTEPIVDIRMYALASMLISMELFYLLKLRHNSPIYILIIICSASMYTHYFAAIISFSMILTFILKYFKIRDLIMIKKLSKILIISGILFLFWVPFLYRQIMVPTTQTYNISTVNGIKCILRFLVMWIVMSIPILWALFHLHNILLHSLLTKLVSTISFTIIIILILFIVRPVFNYSYMYPIFIIYEMISLIILFKYMVNYKNILILIYMSCVILGLSVNFIGSSYYQLCYIDIPTIKIDNNARQLINSRKRNIQLNQKYYNTSIDDSPINFDYAFYLSYYNKFVYNSGINNYFGIRTKPAYKPLFKPVYSHIIFNKHEKR